MFGSDFLITAIEECAGVAGRESVHSACAGYFEESFDGGKSFPDHAKKLR